jgi:excisionase family DNA binding protein
LPRVNSFSTYFSTHAVARMLRVSPSTVLSWIDRGQLPGHRTPGGHRRVECGALLRFLVRSALPIPPELVVVSVVLLVDDDPAFLRATERELRRRAPTLEVRTASDAIDALLHISTELPDAVLLDAHMPGMNGVEVCRRLHDAPATHNLFVVAVTGDPSPTLAEEFRAAGAAECFTKPLDVPGLLRRLGVAVIDEA